MPRSATARIKRILAAGASIIARNLIPCHSSPAGCRRTSFLASCSLDAKNVSKPLRKCQLAPVFGAQAWPGSGRADVIRRWTLAQECSCTFGILHSGVQAAIEAIAEPRRREILRLVRDE